MHLCMYASFSNRIMISLNMFTLHLRTSLAQRKVAHLPWRDLTLRSHHGPREVLEVLRRDLHEALALMVLSGD